MLPRSAKARAVLWVASRPMLEIIGVVVGAILGFLGALVLDYSVCCAMNVSRAGCCCFPPTVGAKSGYLNQMRWYSRLIGWRSRATSAASNRKLMIAIDVSSAMPYTAKSMITWRMAPPTATA